MKRFVIVLILLIMFFNTSAFAADALYRMLHADDVEQFKADQDAIIIGQLIEKKDNSFSTKVLKVLSGKVKDEVIQVEDTIKYFGVEDAPQINDYCFLSIKKAGNFYKKSWYVAKADSGDYRTLKLLNNTGFSDMPAIQWYVNSGGKDKDFTFNGEKIFVVNSNGESVEITDENSKKKHMSVSSEIKKDEEDKKRDNTIYYFLGSMVTIGIAIILVKKLKKKNEG